MSDLDFLGFHISKDGYRPKQDRVKKIKKLQKPKTIATLCRFIVMFNHYRISKKEAPKALAPLNENLKGRTPKNDRTPVPWTP